MPRVRFRSMPPLALATLIGGCAVGASGPLRYVGPAPACGGNEGGGSTATLTRHGKTFAFAPYDGSLVVDGVVAADGGLSGSLLLHPAAAPTGATAAARPAQSLRPGRLTVDGHVAPDAATVRYAAPGCSATVTLARVRSPLL